MTNKIGVAILVSLLGVGSALAAGRSEVLVTEQANKKGSNTYALDFYSDGTVSGFQFDLDGVGQSKPDVSRCGVKAPAGFSGGCTVRDGFVRVLFYSTELKSLPEGWHDLGSVTLSRGAKVARLTEVNVSDAYGKSIDAGVRIEAAASAGGRAK